MFAEIVSLYHGGTTAEQAAVEAALDQMIVDGAATVSEIFAKPRYYIQKAYLVMYPVATETDAGYVFIQGVEYLSQGGKLSRVWESESSVVDIVNVSSSAFNTAIGSITNSIQSIEGEVATKADNTEFTDTVNVLNTELDTKVAIKGDGSNELRLVYPDGGVYRSGANEVGAVKVTLPEGFTNKMLFIHINMYDHTINESFEIVVCGYTRDDNTWINTSSYVVGSPRVNRIYAVRYGMSGTNACFYIGDLATTWQYIGVTISNVEIGHTSGDYATWGSGWGVSLETVAFENITAIRYVDQVGRTIGRDLIATENFVTRTHNQTPKGIRSSIVYAENGTLSVDTTQTKAIDIKLDVGTGVAKSIDLGYSMTGDYGGVVFSKDRGAISEWRIQDTIRGPGKILGANTAAEFTDATSITSFDSTGFSVGTDVGVNALNGNFVHFINRTDSKVTGLTSAGLPYTSHYSTARGFSIIKYVGNFEPRHYIPHHLGKVPAVSFVKNLDDPTLNWVVCGELLGFEHYVNLNTALTRGAEITIETDTETDLSFGASLHVNGLNQNIISYTWTAVEGISAFKTYQGTGVNGNDVNLGIDLTKPGSQVWIKCIEGVDEDWVVYDNIRGTTKPLSFNITSAEGVTGYLGVTFTEFGFVAQDVLAANTLGNTYLVMAFTADYFEPISTGVGVNSSTVSIAKGSGTDNLPVDEAVVVGSSAHIGLEEGINYIYVDDSGVVNSTLQKPTYGLEDPNVVSPSDSLLYTTPQHRRAESYMGIASASSTYNVASFLPWKAFEKDTATLIGDGVANDHSVWVSLPGKQIGEFLKYEFHAPKTVTSVRFRRPYATYDSPGAFTLSASNDNVNWVTLTTAVGIVLPNPRDWTQLFTFTNTTAYKYYKFTIDAIDDHGNTVAYIAVGELELNFKERVDWYDSNKGIFITDKPSPNIVYIGECYADSSGKAITAKDYKPTGRFNDLEIYRDFMVKDVFNTANIVEPYTPTFINGAYKFVTDLFYVMKDALNMVHIYGIIRYPSQVPLFTPFVLPEELEPVGAGRGEVLFVPAVSTVVSSTYIRITYDGHFTIQAVDTVTASSWTMVDITYKAKG